MKIHSGTYEFSGTHPTVITIGTFDGVHKGHAEIIHHLKSWSQLRNLESVVLTFHPHPRTIVRTGDHSLGLLTTMEERVAQMAALGVDHMVIQPFTEEFSRLTPFEFVRDILLRDLNADTIIIGHDHRFGRNREGNFQALMELSETFGFNVQEIPAQLTDGIRVSSSKIRQALADGHMQQAESFLGRPYQLIGEVVKGDGRGRKLGYPTMNLKCHADKMLPGIGVYAVTVILDEMNYSGVMNIGRRPTFKDEQSIHVEVHLPNYSGDAYGVTLIVVVNFKIRDEKKFGTVEELTQAIQSDIASSQKSS